MTDINKLLAKALRASDLDTFHKLKAKLQTQGSFSGESFHNVVAAGFDLSGFDLSNTEWDGCLLEHMNFDNSDLEGAYFNGTTLLDGSFVETSLETAAMDACVFKRVVFQKTNLNDTEFAGSDLEFCSFKELSLDDVDWSLLTFSQGNVLQVMGNSGTFREVTFREVKVENFVTSGLTLKRCVGSGSTIPDGFMALSGNRQRIT